MSSRRGGFAPAAHRPKLPRLSRPHGTEGDSDGDDNEMQDVEEQEGQDVPMVGTSGDLGRGEGDDDYSQAGIGDDNVEMGEGHADIHQGDDEDRDSGSEGSMNEPDTIIDLDDVRDGVAVEVPDRTVRVDPLDMLGAANYDEAIELDIEEPEAMPFEGDDEGGTDTSATLSAGPGEPSQAVEGTAGEALEETPDISTLVEMHQNKYLETSKLEKALAAYADLYGLSRDQWTSLREVLHIVRDADDKVPADIANLPLQLSTLLDRFRRRMPLMNMREANIPLKAEKLPTEARTRRAKLVQNLRQRVQDLEEGRRRGMRGGKRGRGRPKAYNPADDPQAKITQIASTKLTFFDPPTVIQNLAASDIFVKDMHQGPGIFVDRPSELFHSRAWTSSVRASAGIYPHLSVPSEDSASIAIFPGDFVYYRCVEIGCFCHEIENDSDKTNELHIGRIVGFGYDMRADSCTDKSDQVLALQMQPAITAFDTSILQSLQLDPPFNDTELILASDFTYIPETHVFAGLDVFKDYEYGECLENPSMPTGPARRGRIPKVPKVPDVQFPKYEKPVFPKRTDSQYYYVRRVLSKRHSNVGNSAMVEEVIVSLCHTHPIRGELELDCYTREYFETQWDQAQNDAIPVASIPLQTFIDGFGVFSNSYRSLLGYYITPCALKAKDRLRPGNIIPLVLGPHGSDFSDIVKGLGTLVDLDYGIEVEINGVTTLLCAWTMVFIGDQPQQAENCGFKSPRAHKFCRCCYIGVGQKSFADPSSTAEFDSVTHGRYHHQVTQMQQTMASYEGAKKVMYGSQWGIKNPFPALQSLAPALDIILSRPYDPCHSEYSGLFNLAHFLFRDGILNPNAVDEYTLELRAFQFPPGARRLQSPKHHLSSYEMSAHAVWGIIIPLFLREWLEPSHLKPRFLAAAREHGDPIDVIISAFTNMARSATVLVGNSAPKEDYDNLAVIVRQGRESFNLLCYIASMSAVSRAGSRAGSRIGSRAGSVIEGDDDELSKGMALLHMNDTQRPNMHIATHYPDFAAEYAMMVNCNTLTGEDLHR
ncbi:hypothetical protein F4775DRAFT_597943 [Biscogniauxia sp. FL1348]|nr:hypothetical protein F4775DRAFT_597943 [Biscogniauxia sp. FL1348]